MPRRIAQTQLNATTLDILNVIRQNASIEYQNEVPEVTSYKDIPQVGEVIYGNPSFANQFLNQLVNRIASVRIQSATFNNPYARLKKGYIEFGETIEDIFVGILNAVYYTPENAEADEFKRTIPDVKAVFHTMNWRVVYPVTIQDEDLRTAFLSVDGVQSLISTIVEQVYTAAEYDEFLLFKYMLIKQMSHGKFYPVSVGTAGNTNNSAVQFRGISNTLPFMKSQYNEMQVKTTTPKSRQVIFMDAMFNAKFDVETLAAAFNMDKANFMGSLYLIDDWTSFDNERFKQIRSASDGIEEVTAAELALLANVQAVILDENWFQVYDNLNKITEKYVASKLYWNYFYHVWKTISYSPFANAVCFVTSTADIALPHNIDVEITDKAISEAGTIFTLEVEDDTAGLGQNALLFVQTEALTKAGIAIQKYGAVIIPPSQTATSITLVAEVGGVTYTAKTAITSASDVGDTVTMNDGTPDPTPGG